MIMVFLPVIVGIIVLVALVAWLKLDTFIAFMLVCLLVGLWGGLSLDEAVVAIQTGIGNTLGSLVIILGFGAILGKLLAESGGAKTITLRLVEAFGMKKIQLALITTGFIVGIPMFYSVGFVILVPLAIAIAHETRLSLLYVGLPMLASLSVTHGFLPPHPAPTAISSMYDADLGMTFLYGIIVGIPAILSAKFLLSGTMRRIQPALRKEFVPTEPTDFEVPSVWVSMLVALSPVVLIAGSSLLGLVGWHHPLIDGIGNPAIAMLISVLLAIYFLGIRTGRSMTDVGRTIGTAIAGIALVLLVIAGAGALKQILVATQVSEAIGAQLGGLGLSPLIMAWLIAAIIRVSVGSATVAGLTAAGIMEPLVVTSGVAPELLVLATGAGSITFSHVNDSGFWLYKEYFNLSVKETLQSWTLMETTVSVVGLIGVLLLNLLLG